MAFFRNNIGIILYARVRLINCKDQSVSKIKTLAIVGTVPGYEYS
jgi:hypothetical protein